MRSFFFCILIFITVSLHAEVSGEIGVISETSFPYTPDPVFPTEISLFSAVHLISYPTSLLSFFLDAESQTGLSASGRSVDHWFAEGDIALDMSIDLAGMIFRLGSDAYAFTDSDNSYLVELNPFLSATGGGAKLNWTATISAPVSIEDEVTAHIAAESSISVMAGDSSILEPSLSFTTPGLAEGSLRFTCYGNGPVILDTSLTYGHLFESETPHQISWDLDLSLFLRPPPGIDLTISLPGSIQHSAETDENVVLIMPLLSAGTQLGSRMNVKIDFGSEISTAADAFGYLSASLLYKY